MSESVTVDLPAAARHPRATYRHGDLARALQQAVLEIIGERGVGGVTMAEAARRAGVSTAAPYRHYDGLESLLAATAETNYQAWRERRIEHAAPPEDPFTAIMELHDDFFGFARDEPAAFVLIFDSGIQRLSRVVGDWGRAEHVALRAVVSRATGLPEERCEVIAMSITALTVGHAKMSLDGRSGLDLEQAAGYSRAAVRALIAGFVATAS